MDRTIQPEIQALKNFHILPPVWTTLPNGIPLAIVNAGEQEVVRIDILFAGGRWQQSQKLQALFTNRMLREGTRKYTAAIIAEKLDYYGSWLELSSSSEYAYITVYSLNKYLAKIMNNFPSYDVKMTEVHHIHKLDAPSGTAITLAEGILENIDRKDRWTLENAESATDLPIHAIREGEVPGIHEITYESDVDTISIKHDAKSRAGFALGAVVAAEFTAGKKGFLGMNDLFKF